ncbi:hypothetical protein HNQ42_000534 [Rummeliibacillus stabekisii]|nr:hypothetical protein [Rummeliibacillus stabekisii]
MWIWYVVSLVISLFVTFIIFKITHVVLFVFPPLAVILVHLYYKRKPDKGK